MRADNEGEAPAKTQPLEGRGCERHTPQHGVWGDLGACVRMTDGNGDDLGLAHLPHPVEPGDLAALEQGFPLRVVAVVEFEVGSAVDVLPRSKLHPSA